jgi:hypothetical protein
MGSMEELDNDEDNLVNEIDSFLIEDDDIWCDYFKFND